MASVTARRTESESPLGAERVDPRAPRFGQAITASLLLVGIALDVPMLVYAVTVILGVAVVSDWKLDLYRILWRYGAMRFVERPRKTEAAEPHRFAKLLGLTFTMTATILLVSGVPLAGYAVAGMVALLAGVAAAFDLCVGCKMYRQVSFFREQGWV